MAHGVDCISRSAQFADILDLGACLGATLQVNSAPYLEAYFEHFPEHSSQTSFCAKNRGKNVLQLSYEFSQHSTQSAKSC